MDNKLGINIKELYDIFVQDGVPMLTPDKISKYLDMMSQKMKEPVNLTVDAAYNWCLSMFKKFNQFSK